MTAVAIFASASVNAALNDSVVASYSFNSYPTGTFIDNVGGNNLHSHQGALNTGVDFTSSNAKLGAGALIDDGTTQQNGGMYVVTDAGLTIPSANSMGAWVFLNGTSDDSNVEGIIGYGAQDCTVEWSVNINYVNNTPSLTTASASGSFAEWDALGVTLNNNTWYHVAVTQDNGTNPPIFYVNGVAYSSTKRYDVGTIAGQDATGANAPIRAGSECMYLSLNGQLDEAALWNRVLTPTEVLTLYNNGTGLSYPFTIPCTSSWSCSLYGACEGNNVSACLAVTDANACGVTFNGTLSTYDNSSCEYTCNPSWSCSAYGTCENNNISACLTVNDTNNCGVPFNGTLSDYNGYCAQGGYGSGAYGARGYGVGSENIPATNHPSSGGGGGGGGGVAPLPKNPAVTKEPTPEKEPALPEKQTPAEVRKGPKQLFDITFNLQNALISNASGLEAVVTFESFGTEPTPVDAIFIIQSETGKELYRANTSLTVTVQEVLRWNYTGLTLPEGNYIAILQTAYGEQVVDSFTQKFEVRRRATPFADFFIAIQKYKYETALFIAILALAAFMWLRHFRKTRVTQDNGGLARDNPDKP